MAYLLPEFVEDARKAVGMDWPTEDHQIVAENACLGNPDICTMDSLQDTVRRVINIPAGKIRTVTMNELMGRI